MSQQLPQDGVALVVKGASKFIQNMEKSGVAWDSVSASFKDAEGQAKKLTITQEALSDATEKAGGAAKQSKTGWATMASGVAGAMAVTEKILGIIGKVVKAVVDLPMSAAPLEGLSTQFATLTSNIEGGTSGMLRALQEGSSGMIPVRDLLKSFNDASALVSDQFAQSMPEALELFGKVAAGTGEDIGYLMDSYVRGIGRTSAAILDNLKIQVSQAEATQRATEMYGIQADALSKVQIQTALQALTLEKLEQKFGAMPSVADTSSAQMAMFGAHLQNIKDTLGEALLPAFLTFMKTLNRVTGAFSAAIAEGGGLNKILIAIGAMLDMSMEGWAAFGEFIAIVLEKLGGDMGDSIASTIDNALKWGVELVASFAEGMVDAASTVLIQGLNFIGNILEQWLLGASPPKIAPGIKGWGIHTMEMYLEGMTEADFGILKDIQGPLGKILEKSDLANVSKTIAGALAGGDRGTIEQVINKSAGVFSDAINKMVSIQFELADTTQRVQEAEESLARSREKMLAQQGDVNKETVEYNRLLREGASPEILAAQLKQINAAEEAMKLTQDQLALQEESVAADKLKISDLQTEASLQKKLVDELLSVNDALQVENKERDKGVKGKGGPAAAVVPEVSGLTGALGTRFGDAIEKMKGQLKEKFKEIFAPLGEAWDRIVEKVGGIGEAWTKFKDKVGNVWDDLKKKFPVLQDIEDLIQDLKTSIPELVTDLTGNFWEAWDKIWGILSGQEDGGVLGALTAVWDYLKDQYGTLLESDAAKAIKDFTTNIIERLATGIADITTKLGNFIAKVAELARQPFDKIREALGWGIAESPAPFALGLQQINSELGKMSNLSIPQLQGSLQHTMMPAMAPVSSSVTTNNGSPISIVFSGNVNIGTQDDMRRFNAQLERTVRNAIERR